MAEGVELRFLEIYCELYAFTVDCRREGTALIFALTDVGKSADRFMGRNGHLGTVRMGAASSAVLQRRILCTRTERAFHWGRQNCHAWKYKEW